MTLTPADGIGEFAFPIGTAKSFILEGDGIAENVLPQTGSVQRYYHFSAGSGSTIADASTNTDDASLTNGSWASGYDGFGSVVFDGTAYATHSAVTFSSYTFCLLFKVTSITSGSNQTLWNTAQNDDVLTREDGNGNFSGHHQDSNNFQQWSASGLSADTWELWFVRFDGSTVEVIDKRAPATESLSAGDPVIRSGTTPTIGAFNGSEIETMTGEFSLALLWDTDLTNTEIDDLATDLGF